MVYRTNGKYISTSRIKIKKCKIAFQNILIKINYTRLGTPTTSLFLLTFFSTKVHIYFTYIGQSVSKRIQKNQMFYFFIDLVNDMK